MVHHLHCTLLLPPLHSSHFCIHLYSHDFLSLENVIFRYVRCKRRNQTYFIHVSKSDTIGAIKERIYEAASVNAVEDESQKNSAWTTRLFLNEKELSNAGTIADHEIVNDTVIGVTFGDEELRIDSVSTD